MCEGNELEKRKVSERRKGSAGEMASAKGKRSAGWQGDQRRITGGTAGGGYRSVREGVAALEFTVV